MKRRGRKSFWRQKQFLIAGAIMVVAAAAMTYVYMSARNSAQDKQLAKTESTETEKVKSNTEDPATSVTKIITPQPKKENETAKIAPSEQKTQKDTSQAQKQDAAKANANHVKKELHFSEKSAMNWPLQGNVILNYSMDQTVYFSTLDQYKYNPAVIIAGSVNQAIKSAAAGKITNVSNSEETGCTVTEDLGDGYQAIYGQLKEVPVKAGEYVDAGSTIGYLSEPTKYYSVEGCNLYFEVKKDGNPVNPVTFFQ